MTGGTEKAVMFTIETLRAMGYINSKDGNNHIYEQVMCIAEEEKDLW